MVAQTWIYLWLAVLIASIVVELITVGLTSIWMAGGALAGLIAAALHAPTWLQILLFFGVTFVLLFFTRPWAMKYLNAKRGEANNNEEPLGKEVRVIEEINNKMETGKVMHRGIEWTARAKNPEEVISFGEFAEVVEVSGVKLVVERKLKPVGEAEPEPEG